MSTRTNIRPTPVITAGDMAADITSTATILQSVSMVSYSVAWTGTSPIGDLSVEASNDCIVGADGTVTGGTWNPVPLVVSGTTVTGIPISGNSGNGLIDIPGLSAYAVRLFYDRSSGTGSISATVTGKVM